MWHGRARRRYAFTLEDVRLTCASGLLVPADSIVPPTVSLSWRSHKKKAFGGTVRALQAQSGGSAGAVWTTPVSMACSLTMARGGTVRCRPLPVPALWPVRPARRAGRA